MWLVLSVIGYTLLALAAIIDKYLLSSAKVQPVLYTFYSTIFVLPLLFLVPFGVKFLNTPFDWLITVVSGISFSLALWTMFLGFEKSEVSHIGPLVGAVTPLFVLLFSRIFLFELLTIKQFFGVGFLIIGSLLVSFEKNKKKSGWHIGVIWGVLAGIFFAASHVSAKYVYNIHGFYSGFIWTRSAIGLVGLMLLFHPVVRSIFFKNTFLDKIKNKVLVKKTNKNNIVLVIVNKVLGSLGVVIIQYAIAIGSVSLVNALVGLEYAILIILILMLSKFWPKIFKEDYEKGEITLELISVSLISIGLVLLV